MSLIHIPLVHGLNEGVDTKLMPQGFLSRAENIRWRKDGRMGSRYGYDFISGSQGQAIAAGNFGPNHAVYFKERTTSNVPTKWWDRREDGTFTTPASASCAGAVGVPRRTAIVRNTVNGVVACDSTYNNGYLWVVYHDYGASSGLDAGLFLIAYEAKGGRVVLTAQLAVSGPRNPRIVSVGTTVLVVYADGNNVKVISYSASSLTQTGSGTVGAAAAGDAPYFDVCPNDSSTALMVWQTGAALLEWGTLSTAGAYTRKATQVVANPCRATIVIGATSGNVAVAWAEGATFATGNLNYGTWTTAGAVVIAKTTVDSSGFVQGYPALGQNTVSDWTVTWNTVNGNTCNMNTFSSGGSMSSAYGQAAISRPFSAHNGTFVWAVPAVIATGVGGFGTYKLVDAVTFANQILVSEAVSCQLEAMPGNYYLLPAGTLPGVAFVDPRRSTMAVPTIEGKTGMTATLTTLPVTTSHGFGADAIRIESGTFADKLLTASINGQLFFSGGRIREYDGSILYETGLAQGPEDVQLTSAGGAIAAGTYQYVVVFEWFDHAGRRHRSPPSAPVSITLGAPSNVTVKFNGLFTSDRDVKSASGVFAGCNALIYRTLASGTIFYLVNSVAGVLSVVRTQASYTDSSSDATIAVNEVLYTQGARGGLSGLLPNDEPPPAAFIWAGNNRLFMGGLEDRSAVQWSKLIFPGEPVQFTINAGFKARVDGDVTAIAALDGTWYVFTRDSIWTIAGDGPDDNGGGGSFSDPRKLPSDVGCISQRSVLETSQGLFFQARSDRMYMIPRGGGAPVFVGQPVRDTLASFPQVMWTKMLPEENLAIWSLQNAAGTASRLLVFDLRIGEWSVDKIPLASSYLFNTLDVYGGKLAINGELAETSAWADDTTGAQNFVIAMTAKLGSIRPFGAEGWGRTRRFNLLMENRCATASFAPQIDVSRDDGVTYEQSATNTFAAAQGTTLEFAVGLQTVRGNSWVFQISAAPFTPDEGVVFNAVSLEVFPSQSGPLLASAQMG